MCGGGGYRVRQRWRPAVRLAVAAALPRGGGVCGAGARVDGVDGDDGDGGDGE